MLIIYNGILRFFVLNLVSKMRESSILNKKSVFLHLKIS